MRARGLALMAAVAVFFSPFATTARASGSDTFYLTSDGGYPHSTLSTVRPENGDLPNFDPGRDISPGLLLQRSSLGLQTIDEARYQHWQTDVAGMLLEGAPTLVLWGAVKDFDVNKTGLFTAYLLDCPEWGEGCLAFAAAEGILRPGPGDTWVEMQLFFRELRYEIAEGRALGVRVVVSAESDDDLWIAYDRLNYRSRLVFASDALASVLDKRTEAVLSTAVEGPPGPNGEEVIPAQTPSPEKDQSAEPLVGGDFTREQATSFAVAALLMGVLGIFLLDSLSARTSLVHRRRIWDRLKSIYLR